MEPTVLVEIIILVCHCIFEALGMLENSQKLAHKSELVKKFKSAIFHQPFVHQISLYVYV